jgi:predicted Rossmann-fold nucleotide-binding protein
VIVKADALERVAELLRCDLVIVLPGHIGTLSEMFAAWVSAIEGHLPSVMLVGPKLKDLLDYLTTNEFLETEHADHVSVFNSVGELPI